MAKKEKVKKPFYKKWWVWLLAVILIGSFANLGEDTDQNSSTSEKKTSEEVASTNDSSEKIEKEDTTEEKEAEEKATVEDTEKEDSVPREHKSALKKAEQYAKTMHMSKEGIYDQLTSEYGENFPKEAAQYAIDNIEFDWKANALEKAKSYAESMDMSDSAIYDQLISEYGEKFTAEEAQYAVDNLE